MAEKAVTKTILRSGGVRVRSDRLSGHDPEAGSGAAVVPGSSGTDSSRATPRLQLRRPGEGARAESVGRSQPQLDAAPVYRREEVQSSASRRSRTLFHVGDVADLVVVHVWRPRLRAAVRGETHRKVERERDAQPCRRILPPEHARWLVDGRREAK